MFTDPKGELYDKTAGYLKANGYDIKVFNLINPKNSDGYNPLLHIKNDIDVDIIANIIVKGQSDSTASKDPFWDNTSEMLLKSLIYYLIDRGRPEERNLASCAELVRAANNNGGENLLTNLMSKFPPEHPARKNYKSIETASDKTYGTILTSLQSNLGKFDSADIAELTATNTINFEDIGRKKTAVYVISSDTHGAYDFLLTIFFSQMIQQLYDFADINGGRLPVPTYFILDEFANIGRIPDFDKKISTSRSRGISFSVILQTVDQLEAIYEKSYETIMGNCDTHLFLGSNSQKTVEYFSKALGEKTITRDSISVSKDKDSRRSGSNISDQSMARALLTPDELRRLDNDLCIIYEKGIKPVKASKYYYFRHPEAKYKDKYPIDHNNLHVDRGAWRIHNPYKPYEEEEEKEIDESKIQSLDDLFGDEEPVIENKVDEEKQDEPIINEIKDEHEPEEPIIEQEDSTDDPFADLLSTTEDSEEEKEDVEGGSNNMTIDIQKELEAKFDELFGSIEGTTSSKK